MFSLHQAIILPVPDYDPIYTQTLTRLDPMIGSSTFIYWNALNAVQGVTWLSHGNTGWKTYIIGLLDTIPKDVVLAHYDIDDCSDDILIRLISADLDFIFNHIRSYYAHMFTLREMISKLASNNMFLEVDKHVRTPTHEYITATIRERIPC